MFLKHQTLYYIVTKALNVKHWEVVKAVRQIGQEQKKFDKFLILYVMSQFILVFKCAAGLRFFVKHLAKQTEVHYFCVS